MNVNRAWVKPGPLGAGVLLLIAANACGDGRSAGEPDCAARSAASASALVPFEDTFAGDGPLVDYVVHNAEAVPDVARVDGRYRAAVLDNTDDRTLHFFRKQGRLDARLVSFPFDLVVRNIGIGRLDESQVAPDPVGTETFVFAGVQVHDVDLDAPNSSHVVVGHRGATTFTIEGKNTCDGVSVVDDAGPGVAPLGRADLRLVGNPNRTISVYHQPPNLNAPTTPDQWLPYRGTGQLPGTAPGYGADVYVGLITYAAGDVGLPFVGTADSIEELTETG